MTIGENIKNYRLKTGLTQKDLSDRLSVSFQTISKWENNTNEPDINTLKQLCSIFDCTMEELLYSKEEIVKPVEEETKVEEVATIEEKQEITKPVKEKKPRKTLDKDDKKVLIWSIVIGVIVFGITLASFIANPDGLEVSDYILGPIVFGYTALATIFCLFTGTWIADVFIKVSGWSIKFPGIIFSFSLDGLKFLILMKLLFVVIGFFFGLFVLLLAIVLSCLLSIFTFPFAIIFNRD